MKLRKEINDRIVECIQRGISHISRIRFTEEERNEIERRGIDIHCMSVYMDGTGDYSLERKGN